LDECDLEAEARGGDCGASPGNTPAGDDQVVLADGFGLRGEFEAAASEAVAAWRYLPRVVNGRPVAQRSSVTVRFSVED